MSRLRQFAPVTLQRSPVAVFFALIVVIVRAQSGGPVASNAFIDGTATTTADKSRNGNTGTIHADSVVARVADIQDNSIARDDRDMVRQLAVHVASARDDGQHDT